MKKLISIVSPTFNEEDNVEALYQRLVPIMDAHDSYEFEIIFIDNASTDKTAEKTKELARMDRRVKLIVNTRNFGHIRSPYWAILQARGDAVICMASDLQDPPELIPDFLESWEQGYKITMGIKPTSKCNPVMHQFRKLYYAILDSISDVPIAKNATGFGLYDKVTCPPKPGPGIMLEFLTKEDGIWPGKDEHQNRL